MTEKQLAELRERIKKGEITEDEANAIIAAAKKDAGDPPADPPKTEPKSKDGGDETGKTSVSTLVERLAGPVGDVVASGLKTELEDTMKSIVASAVEQLKSDLPKPSLATNYEEKLFSDVRQAPKAKDADAPGMGMARIIRTIAMSRGNPELGEAYARKAWHPDVAEDVIKAMQAGDFEGGGFLVPEAQSNEVIDLLRPVSAVRRSNPVEVELNGSLTLPKLTQGATANWKGENQQPPPNASKFLGGNIKLTARELETKVLISEKLQRQSPTSADALVRRDMIRAMANAEDLAFLRGTGSENVPRGMTSWALTGNVFNTAGVTLANIRSDLRKMIDNLTSANVMMQNPAFFMSHRSRNFLAWQVETADNVLAFGAQLADTSGNSDGRLNGIPVYATNNIPNNLGGGSNESEVILADMADIVIGDGPQLRVKVSNEASVTDSTGTLRSTFEEGLIAIIIESEVDLVSRHQESITVMEQVAYGQ